VGIEFKLKDVPDLEYYGKNLPFPQGELLIRGPSIFKGYFRNPELTHKNLDESTSPLFIPLDGFLHSGDVVELRQGNRIVMIDRIKNIFKLAQVRPCHVNF
jgi:long-chain acyl-CoA synthetase